jgi:pyruvate dehydrogenase (quinone)
LLGFKGIFCDNPKKMGAAWEQALKTKDRPVLLEVKTDPDTPPLPPHIRLEMAQKFSSALTGDEPNRWEIMEKSFKGKAVEFIDKFTES